MDGHRTGADPVCRPDAPDETKKKHAITPCVTDHATVSVYNVIHTKRERKKREPALGTICDEFLALYNKHHNIRIAHVLTAVPIKPELTEILRHLLEEDLHSTIQITTTVDERIIGGLMVEIDGYLYDASLLTRINRLRAEFSHNVYQAAF